MQRPIGDKFLTPEGVELEVVEGSDCDGCDGCFADSDSNRCGEFGECLAWYRQDNKDVIFKQTK